MIKLSICIPTYNRPEDIKALSEQFIRRALDVYESQIEIVVCDNSNEEIAGQNRLALGEGVRHFINEKNIGFAGNFIRCAREATGEFLWIISDNDPVVWSGFERIMELILSDQKNNTDCIMVCFKSENVHGEAVISNRLCDWGGGISTVKDLIDTGIMPFVLFSSGVIRRNSACIDRVAEDFKGNDYIQTALYLNMLKASSRVIFSEVPALFYMPEYIGRIIGIASMSNSMRLIRDFIEVNYGVKSRHADDYAGWIMWIVHHRAGVYKIPFADSERWGMLARLPNNFSSRALVLCVLILLPKLIIRPIYLAYRSFSELRSKGEGISIRLLSSRIRSYNSFIRRTHGG